MGFLQGRRILITGMLSNRAIYTKYSIQVTETLKGSPTPSISVLVPGGPR